MTTKLNSFTIADDTIRAMEHLSGLTFVTRSEHGFNLCLDRDNIIRPGNVCKGEKCSIDVSEFNCKENERTVGIFHTHDEQSNPSMSDLSVGYLVGISCIGNPKDIKCYSRKKDIDGIVYADIKNVKYKEDQISLQHSKWKNKEISNREYTKIYNKYKKEADRIINSYFKEQKINY